MEYNKILESHRKIKSTTVDFVKVVINTVIKRLLAYPAHMGPTEALDVVTSSHFFNKYPAIGTTLHVRVPLCPVLQQPLLLLGISRFRPCRTSEPLM